MKNRPSCRSGASGKLAIQHVLGDLAVLHVADMTKPVQAPLGKQGKHAWYSCLSQDVLVLDTVLSGDAQNPSKAVQVESIESVCLVGVQRPYFTAIEQHAEHAGLIHLHLGVDGQHGVFPDPLCKVSHCCCWLANLCAQFDIQGEVAGDGGTKVGEILYHLKDVVTNGDTWDATEVLAHVVGFLKTDSKTKLYMCMWSSWQVAVELPQCVDQRLSSCHHTWCKCCHRQQRVEYTGKGSTSSHWCSIKQSAGHCSWLSWVQQVTSLEGSILCSTSTALLAVITGSSSAIPSSNQSGFCLSLLLKVSMAEL